jgi:hypothetical protein
MKKPPAKVRNCTTHHACDCIQYKLEEYERALKVILTWSAVALKYPDDDAYTLTPRCVYDMCERTLHCCEEH